MTSNRAEDGVSVVIPLWNNESTIGLALDSLVKQKTERPVEVILVDDHSNDRSRDISEKHLIRSRWSLRVILNERGGLAASYNLGWKNALYEIVIFMHADCYVESEHALESIVKVLDDAGVVAAEPVVCLSPDDWNTMSFWDKVTSARYAGEEKHGLGGKFDAIRRSALEHLRGFDEKRFHNAGEDCDMVIRLGRIGGIIFSEARVVHTHRHPAHRRLRSIWRKQAQLGQGFGTVLRKHWKHVFSTELRIIVIIHGVKGLLILGMLVPFILCAPFFSVSLVWALVPSVFCTLVLLLLGTYYSWRALFVRNWRIVLIPFVNVFQFTIFFVFTLAGVIAGRQRIKYK